MKYGLIKDNNVNIIGEIIDGQWQGNIYYNADNSRKTAKQVISDLLLKEIVIPSSFDGNSTHYQYVEQNGKIVLTELKIEIIKEKEKKTYINRISQLKKLLSETDYKIIKCFEYQLANLIMPYDFKTLQAQRQAFRNEINILESKNSK